MEAPGKFQRLAGRLAKAWHERGIGLKAVSFGLVGVLNSAIDFGVFWTAVQHFGMRLVPANVLAWLVAVSVSYVMNSVTTFAAESGRRLRWRSYAAFVAAGIVGVTANTATLLIADYVLAGWLADDKLALASAKGCAILASFVVNFAMSHFVVFRARENPADEAR